MDAAALGRAGTDAEGKFTWLRSCNAEEHRAARREIAGSDSDGGGIAGIIADVF